jgi:hypothetical protein
LNPIVAGILIVGAISFFIFMIYREQKRVKALRLWTRSRGWSFDKEKRKGWERDYPGVKLFQNGHSRHGKNVISGTFHDRPITLVDYRYVTGHGKHRTEHHAGVAILQCEFPTIPLFIRRENAFDKVGEFLGADDIDFESVEFSKKFFVKSADRKWAHDIIHTRVMDYLLAAPSVTIEFGFGEIAVYRNKWGDGQKYEEALDVAWNLYRLIPEYVIQQMRGSAQ